MPSDDSDEIRFERAAVRFLQECVGQLARELVLQGWLTAFLCHEFGWGRVYREVHVQASDLLKAVPDWELVQRFRLREDQTKGALSPDVAISRRTELDARSSFLRPEAIRGSRFSELLSVVAELKATESTGSGAALERAIRRDMCKLGLYAAAASSGNPDCAAPALYMIVLDNSASQLSPVGWLYDCQIVEDVLRRLQIEWRSGVPAPTLLVGGRQNGRTVVHSYRGFRFCPLDG